MRDLKILGLIVAWLALIGHGIVRAGLVGALVVTVGVVLVGIGPSLILRLIGRRAAILRWIAALISGT